MAGKPQKREEVAQPDDPSIKFIPLTKGKVATVDVSDYEMLMQWSWNAHQHTKGGDFYAARSQRFGEGKKKIVQMHNQIMGQIEGMRVDHINHNSLDNRLGNLRHCTHVQNLHNSPKKRNNKSGFKGVFFNGQKQKWQAKIAKHGKQKHLGFYDTAEAASEAYQKESLNVAGEFAWVHNERESDDVHANTAAT